MDTDGDNSSYSVHVGDKLATLVLWFGCDMYLSASQCIGAIEHCISDSHMAWGHPYKSCHERAVKMFVFKSSDKVDPLKGPGWRIRLAGCVCRRGPCCDTHTTRSDWRPVNPTACLCPDRTKETRETGWRIRSPSSEEVATCSAPSCVCVGSWGVCRTCRNLALCSCTACRWCVRESASSGHYCWQSVDHSHQTRT